MTNMRM